MSFLCSLAVALLLSGAVTTTQATEARGGHTPPQHASVFSARQASTTTTSPLAQAAPACVGTSTTTNGTGDAAWRAVCGGRAGASCVLTYVAALALFGVLCFCWLAWSLSWCPCGSGLWPCRRCRPTRRRPTGGAVEQRRGLLSQHDSDGDESGAADSGESPSVADNTGAFHAHALNLRDSRMWSLLLHTPAGLLYALRGRNAAAASAEVADSGNARSGAIAVNAGDGDDSDGEADSWDLPRDAHHRASSTSAAAGVSRSSAPRRGMHGVVSLATTTTDSANSSEESARSTRASGEERFTHGRCCSRESDRCDAVVTDGDRPVQRGMGVHERRASSRVASHILPQLIHFNSAFDAEEEGNLGGGYSTDSDSQQQACGGLAGTRRSSASRASGTSSSYTPPPHPALYPRTEAGSRSTMSRTDSGVTVCVAAPDVVHDEASPRLALPHVATAIFDTSLTGHAGLSVSDDIAAVRHLHHGMPSSEALCSTVGSHVSEADGVALPSERASTAAPSPVPFDAALTPAATPYRAPAAALTLVLPTTNSLSDGLDMVAGDLVEQQQPADAAPQRHSYVPEPQLLRTQAPGEPPQPPPRRSRSSRYCEPWQPVLASPAAPPHVPLQLPRQVPLQVPRLGSTVPDFSAPNTPLLDSPPCNAGMDALSDGLDDLMLAVEVESARSTTTSDGARVFSGSSSTTSCSATPAVEAEQEAVDGPVDLCDEREYFAAVAPGMPLVTASIPLRPPSPPIAVYAQTAGAAFGLLERGGGGSLGQEGWPSRSAGPRPPLRLSVEERTLLLRSRKWLFPLIDGSEEIE